VGLEEIGFEISSVSFPTALANRADDPKDGYGARARVRSFGDGGMKVHGTAALLAALAPVVNSIFENRKI
jgi:hypothetical protein